jgi:hypothetical protein
MTSDQKKAFLLLKAAIFQHHGMNEEEQKSLQETADTLEATEELNWVNDFISSDVYSAFERARQFLTNIAVDWDAETKLSYLADVWGATNKKGYITEIEATAMLKLAKDWRVQKELMTIVRKK